MINLRNKTTKAISWNAISSGIHQFIMILVAIILTAILSPEDFGLIAMVTIVAGFANILNDFGFSGALIQKKEITEEHKSTVFWTNMVVGGTLTTFFILSAPALARFYNEERIIPIMYVLGFDFVIKSTFLVHFALLKKEIRFKELALRKVIASSIVGVSTVILAILGLGVWALVFQIISNSVINGVLIWWIYKWKPKMTFSWSHFKELFQFSFNVSLIRILQYSAQKLDILLVGKFFGTASLGIYNRAFKFQILPLRAIKSQISSVLFPILSTIQDDFAKQRDIYLKLTGALAFLLIPLMMLLFAVAEEFVMGVLGAKWEELIPLIKIMTIASCISALGFPGGLYMANNKTDAQVRIVFVQQVIRVAAILGGLMLNSMVYLIAFVALSIVINTLIFNFFAVRIIGLSFRTLLISFFPFLLLGSIPVFIVAGIDYYLFNSMETWIQFLLKSAIYCCTYLGLVFIFRPKPFDFMIETMRPIFQQKYNSLIKK